MRHAYVGHAAGQWCCWPPIGLLLPAMCMNNVSARGFVRSFPSTSAAFRVLVFSRPFLLHHLPPVLGTTLKRYYTGYSLVHAETGSVCLVNPPSGRKCFPLVIPGRGWLISESWAHPSSPGMDPTGPMYEFFGVPYSPLDVYWRMLASNTSSYPCFWHLLLCPVGSMKHGKACVSTSYHKEPLS